MDVITNNKHNLTKLNLYAEDCHFSEPCAIRTETGLNYRASRRNALQSI